MVAIPFAIPSIRNVLGIVPLTLLQWSWIAAIAMGMLIAVELGKWFRNLFLRKFRPLKGDA
jgi:hypothetical protein